MGRHVLDEVYGTTVACFFLVKQYVQAQQQSLILSPPFPSPHLSKVISYDLHDIYTNRSCKTPSRAPSERTLGTDLRTVHTYALRRTPSHPRLVVAVNPKAPNRDQGAKTQEEEKTKNQKPKSTKYGRNKISVAAPWGSNPSFDSMTDDAIHG